MYSENMDYIILALTAFMTVTGVVFLASCLGSGKDFWSMAGCAAAPAAVIAAGIGAYIVFRRLKL